MEIETTVKGSLEKLKQFPLNTPVKIIIQEPQKETETCMVAGSEGKKSKYLFLNDDVWDGENTPSDLSTNVDKYLYDEE